LANAVRSLIIFAHIELLLLLALSWNHGQELKRLWISPSRLGNRSPRGMALPFPGWELLFGKTNRTNCALGRAGSQDVKKQLQIGQN
jgi:hypothetical protein